MDVLSLIFAFLTFRAHAALKPIVDWTMVDVNHTDQQGDAHLLRFSDGQNILVDTGIGTGVLVKFLHHEWVDVIHKLVITHAHRDHYGGIERLLRSSISIREVWMNVPDRAACDAEKPWGCDWQDVERVLALVREHGIPVKRIPPGTVFHSGSQDRFEAIYAFDQSTSPIGKLDINDLSVICKLTAGPTRVLFAGDLNEPLGKYLAASGKGLAAEILKVPHHGAHSLAPNEFFDAVGAKLALVPAPRSLWLSARASRARGYLESHDIRAYVNGLHGHIRVSFSNDGYSVTKGGDATPDLERYGNPVLRR